MINITSIGCPNVQRIAYLFYQQQGTHNPSKLIGRFIQQENDAGEVQYVYDIYFDRLTPKEIEYMVLPGIDLMRPEYPYVRNGETPYFVESCVISRQRGDMPRYLKDLKMDYYDEFEMMLRNRAITHHTNCYLGATPDDTVDMTAFMNDVAYYKEHFPNLRHTPENDFHDMTQEEIDWVTKKNSVKKVSGK